MFLPTSKRCPKCKVEYPLTAEYWSRNKNSKDGYKIWCKVCSRIYNKAWDKAHPEKNRRYFKAWSTANPEKVRNRSRVWQSKHPEQARIRGQRRNTREKELPATLTVREWENILAYYQYACAYCGRAWFDVEGVLQQDHVVPLTQGGGYTADNIVPACRSCNAKKGGRTPEQAGMAVRCVDNFVEI